MSNSKRSRRHFTTEQKVAVLKRHLVDKVPISDLGNASGNSVINASVRSTAVAKRCPRPAYFSS